MSEMTKTSADLPTAWAEDIDTFLDSLVLTSLMDETPAEETSTEKQTVTVLNVPCRVEHSYFDTDKNLAILLLSPQKPEWSFGECLPLLPSNELTASTENTENTESIESSKSAPTPFRLSPLSLDHSMWVFVSSASTTTAPDDIKSILTRELTSLPTITNWADARGVTQLDTIINSLPIFSSSSNTEDEGPVSQLFMWGDLQHSKLQSATNQLEQKAPEALSVLSDLEKFLGATQLRFSQASILQRGRYPSVSLSLPPGGASFGNNALQFDNTRITLNSTPYFTPQDTSVKISSDVTFAGNISVDIEMAYPIDGDLIWAKGRYLGSIDQLLGDDASLGFPDSAPSASGDSLEVELEFSKSNRSVNKIHFTVALNQKKWNLATKPVALSIENTAFYVTIMNPFSANRKVSAQLSSDARLGKSGPNQFLLACGGSYPDGQLFLRAKDRLPIGNLIKNIVGPSNGLDSFVFDELKIDYNYISRLFSLDLDIAGPWEIAKDFEAKDVRLQLQVGDNSSANLAATLQFADIEAHLSANKPSKNSPWRFNATLPEVKLDKLIATALAEFNIDIDLPDITFVNTALTLEPESGFYDFKSQASDQSSWSLPLGVTTLDISNLSLAATKTSNSVSGQLEGTAQLFGASASVSIDLDNNLTVTLACRNINLTQIVDELLTEVDFPAEIPNVIFDSVTMEVTPATKEFTLTASTTEDWEIPLGVTGFLVEDIQLQVERKKVSARKYATTGSVIGNASLGPVNFELNYRYPGELILETEIPKLDFSPVIQDLCGPESLMAVPLPASISNLSLQNVQLTVSPTNKYLSLSSQSDFGETELLITQTKQKKWAFMAAFAPPAQWAFSSIDQALAVMDDLSFSDTALIISSAADSLPPISVVTVPSSVKLVKGLNFFATMDMAGLEVDNLVGVKTLTVSTAIGTNLNSIKLSAAMAGSLKITDGISLGDMEFFLRPAPSNFQLGISGSVVAKIDKSDLRFVGAMSVRPLERSAAFAATMLGRWDEPFGTKGLAVEDVAIEVGIGIVPPPAVAAPIVGLAGSISIGSFSGSAAVKFDTANPNKSMIAAAFNQLYLKDIVQTFCEKKVYNSIPSALRNSILSAGMEDVAVYVVPQLTSIGELTYEPGFKFQGRLSIADFDAEFMFILDYTKGFAIKGSVDPIIIDDVLKITGVENTPGPSIDIDLRIGGDPYIKMEGLVDLMGLSAMGLVCINDQGFRFDVEGKIFDLFTARIAASGSNIKSGGDFYLLVEMQNDLISYLREQALDGIQKAANDATQSLEDAQDDVEKAQKEVNKLNNDISTMRTRVKNERARDTKNVKTAEKTVSTAQKKVNGLQSKINTTRKTVQKERARDTKRLADARAAVNSAKKEVDTLQKNIVSMRKTVNSERKKATADLRKAQGDVTKAQKKVDGLQSQIRTNKNKISSLKKAISNKKRWYNKSKWYQKSYRWAEFSAYSAAKGAEITALYTAIGGLETAKATANGALEVAKQVVRGIAAAATTIPVDSDPRIVALFTAKATATAGLETARQVLKGLEATISIIPVDSDPRIVALFAAKETANAVLEVAEQTLIGLQAAIKNFPIDLDPRVAALLTLHAAATGVLQSANYFLEGLQISIGGLAEASSFIVEYGLGGLLDIKRAKFEGSLNVVKGGDVSMELDLILMKSQLDLALAFSFQDPMQSVELLVQKLLKEIG